MRKLALVTASVVALATAGLAVARGMDDGRSITGVSGQFNAATVSSSQTRTCTTTDGKTIATTKATYTGTASSKSADLTGPITLDTRSVVNTTDGIGTVDGKLKIAASGGDTVARFSTVYDRGNVAGLADGHAATPAVKLLGNLSAGFSTTGGFSGGNIGGGTAGGAAVELGPGHCAPNKTEPEQSEANGTVSAVSSTSITVAGLTCAVPASLAATVGTVKTGDHVEIRCTLSNGTTSLVKLAKKE